MRQPATDYWELPVYSFPRVMVGEKKHLAWAILRKRGILAPDETEVTLNRLLKLLERSDRGLLYYDNYSLEELKSFVDGRGLTYPSRSRRTKKTVIAMLELADDEPRFERLLDLPAELRVHVYEVYFARLSQLANFKDGRNRIPFYHQQPPVTRVSRLLRQETLNMFYEVCSLFVNFNRSGTNPSPRLPLRERTSMAPGTGLAKAANRFKHLHIRVYSPPTKVHAQIRLPRVPTQAGAVVEVGCVFPSGVNDPWRSRALVAARKAEEDLQAIVTAVVERGSGIEWRVQDLEDVARVLKMVRIQC